MTTMWNSALSWRSLLVCHHRRTVCRVSLTQERNAHVYLGYFYWKHHGDRNGINVLTDVKHRNYVFVSTRFGWNRGAACLVPVNEQVNLKFLRAVKLPSHTWCIIRSEAWGGKRNDFCRNIYPCHSCRHFCQRSAGNFQQLSVSL